MLQNLQWDSHFVAIWAGGFGSSYRYMLLSWHFRLKNKITTYSKDCHKDINFFDMCRPQILRQGYFVVATCLSPCSHLAVGFLSRLWPFLTDMASYALLGKFIHLNLPNMFPIPSLSLSTPVLADIVKYSLFAVFLAPSQTFGDSWTMCLDPIKIPPVPTLGVLLLNTVYLLQTQVVANVSALVAWPLSCIIICSWWNKGCKYLAK